MKRIHAHRIEPSGLGRRDKNHGYEFCSVTYQSSARDERRTFNSILYFRNTDRNIYGRIDYSKFTTSQCIRAIANKLIKDARFRAQFMADPEDDEMFTSNWK
jgi:hypothetical protein